MQNRKEKKELNGPRTMALGFGIAIIIGTLLLLMPFSSKNGESMGILNALFTATSSVCVTGLSTITCAETLSTLGQVIQLLLIQLGGLGFMVFGTLLLMIAGRKITLRNRLLLSESMNTSDMGELLHLLKWVVGLTLTIEFTGAALLFIRFNKLFGVPRGLFMSLFHAVSAFCNAGFDQLGGSSLIAFQHDPLVLGTVIGLVTLGSLGFGLIADIITNRRFGRCSVHTRLVLVVTLILNGSAFLLTLLSEWSNPDTLGNMSFGGKLLNALFHAVSLRTAGFASIDQALMNPATKAFSMIFMFIGAAPASTGGGVKLTTFIVLCMLVISIARGRDQVIVFGHSVSRTIMERAMCVFLIAFAVVLADTLLLSALEPELDFVDIMYEAVSAFATVGLSCNLTPRLSLPGRIVIIISMFIGRVGPLTLTLALAHRQKNNAAKIRYPEADILIG